MSIGPVVDRSGKYEEQEKDLLDQFQVVTREKERLQRARGRLFSLFEEETMDRSELASRLNANKQEMLETEGRQGDISERLDVIRVAREKDREMTQFIRDKGAGIEQMLKDIEKLEPADRKRVIESVLGGHPLRVFMCNFAENDGYQCLSKEEKMRLYLFLSRYPLEDGEESFPWFRYHFPFRFNTEIFQWLFDRGKISPIDDPPKGGGKGRRSQAGNGGQLVINGISY